MYVQVIRGSTADPNGVRDAMQRWRRDVSPSVACWLGATAGVTRDGRYIALIRFGSERGRRRPAPFVRSRTSGGRTRPDCSTER